MPWGTRTGYNVFVPIIFVAGCGNIAMSVKAMKNGAVDFLSKPFRDEDLLEAAEIGLARDQAWCDEQRSLSILRSRFETLSNRERQVMDRIVKGKLNKQVAFDLGISEITVKAHRGKVMRKMNATSLPELVRMADKIVQSDTSALVRMRKADILPMVQPWQPLFALMSQGNYCAMGGGAPLTNEDQVVAGVGVSGGSVQCRS